MDLWIVAAAAAAGYIAKFWQDVSRDRDSSSELSSKGSNFEKPESPSCPFPKLARRKDLDKDVSTDRRKVLDRSYSDMCELDGVSVVTSTSNTDGEKPGSLGNYENCNLLSISSLPPRFLHGENLERNECGNGLNGDFGDDSGNPSKADMGSFSCSLRNRSSLRNKHSYRHFVKPLSSLDSCLLAQLYQQQAKMEEYVLTALPSPSMRPLFVTDGSRIISRASGEFGSARLRINDNQVHREAYRGKNGNVLGVPPLPQIGSLDPLKKIKFKSGKGRIGRLSSSSKFSDGSQFRSQGSHDGTVLFCLGISIGVISAFLTNRTEVTKLKELLKQTENLVQDLQEELEMRDSLTVKELVNENYESQDTCDNSLSESMPNTFCTEQHMDNFIKHDDKDLCDKKAEESSESIRKIEAELQAELERIGLNMNSSGLETRLCDFVELDPDFEAVFAQGELRADMINRRCADQPESDKDASGSSTSHSANNGVSPRELSLRLHEVIQSRLEQRVKELEAALESSNRKLQLMESEQRNSWRNFSNCDFRYSSDEESPIAKDECNSMAEPLVMNLSGEALDAYNEAYEELMKINESEGEDSSSGFYEKNHPNGGVNGSLPHLTDNTEKISKEFNYDQVKTSEKHGMRVEESLDVGLSGDENSDFDDEMEKQLIKQIVEKTRKGSPAVLNAQKWLFFMDNDEH